MIVGISENNGEIVTIRLSLSINHEGFINQLGRNRDKRLVSKRIVCPKGDNEVSSQLVPGHPKNDACLTTYKGEKMVLDSERETTPEALKIHNRNTLDARACVKTKTDYLFRQQLL